MSVIKVENLTKIYRQRQRQSGLLAAIKTLFRDDTIYKTAVDDVSFEIESGIDMCRALEVCRELNIVHRDIKPDNIFVSANGKFKLGDFGVARTIEKTMAGLSRKGTYSYMAPEIYNGKEYGFEADIYSLGIVLYKLLNNNRDPFLPPYPAPVKYSDKTEAMVKRIQGLEMPMPANADEKLARIVFKACAHNPSERYLHPKDLRLELESIALGYAELQSEVFSENGINYYTNNSIFVTDSKSEVSLKNDSVVVNDDEQGTYVEDEGTMLLVEPTDDESTVIDPSNFATFETAVNDVKEVFKEENNLCPNCNNTIKPGNVFCGHCGHKLSSNEERSVICPVCGFTMKPGVAFCGKCGHKF